jgi:para-nitrobenzyl esterase
MNLHDRKIAGGLLLTFALSVCAHAASRIAHEPVTIESGRVEGAVSDRVLSFKGIPYAAPVVGDRRWRAPQPALHWDGVRNAAHFGHDCMQLPEPSDAAPLGTHPAEDCLVLNVWRPALHQPKEKLPVLVWIHGGGYVNGGSSAPVYDGSAFARDGVVFVSFNYRLGRFGVFAHPALLAAQEGAVGDFAYMDQIAALQWIARNIAAFSGDAHEVTVMGEAAGGDSVIHLITSPEAKGLFRRAIVMSGGGRRHLVGGVPLTGGTADQPAADQIGENFAHSVGIAGTSPDVLKALRALPAERIRGNLNMSALLKLTKPLTAVKGVIVDGRFVPGEPGERLERGEANLVPVMIGTTTQDLPLTFPPSREDPLAVFGEHAAEARRAHDPRSALPPFEIHLAIGADMTMHEPARFVAKQLTRAQQPVWLYRFGYVAESQRSKLAAAPHASEIPFFFDTIAVKYGKAESERDREAARIAHGYVVNFVKRGDPNGAGLASWPVFDPARPQLLQFTERHGAVYGDDPWKARLDLVERLVGEGAPAH